MKLKNLKPQIALLPPPLARGNLPGDAPRARRADATWRRWYKTGRWQRLRWQILERDLFTCQWPGCGRVEVNTAQLVADHRVPHRGDPALFWQADNLQCLCKACHDRHKQRAEQTQW